MSTSPKQIHITQTLDVEAVESVLAQLWQETAGADHSETDEAVLRSRAANIMVFVTSEAALPETQQTIRNLALIHPCRALVMLADRDGVDRDIEIFVSAFCQTGRRATKSELCCEEITLVARGRFTPELASAVTPLLVPDLPTFLWWQDVKLVKDDNFQPLTHAADRLVIDSVDLTDEDFDLDAMAHLFSQPTNASVAISDVNWARLTSWRGLLANFYDVREYRLALADLRRVQVEYVVPAASPNSTAAQALLIAGWLGSRLGWQIKLHRTEQDTTSFLVLSEGGNEIRLELKRTERSAMKPGRLAKIELLTETGNGVFVVRRSEDGQHLETEATIDGRSCPGRTLPVRNRSTAELLSREMEIPGRDTTYEAAVRVATKRSMRDPS